MKTIYKTYFYRKTKKNAFIQEMLKLLDELRNISYEENQVDWFHRMNELSIWVGEQLDYRVVEEEIEVDDCDDSEAIITM